MFELSLAEKEHCIPLQKVMSAPCVDGDVLRWIIQVSRKGHTAEEAGADFTAQDLARLEQIAATVATLPL